MLKEFICTNKPKTNRLNPQLSAYERLSITALRDVWPQRRALLLSELQLQTIGDLLQHFPLRYVDKTATHAIVDLHPYSGNVQVKGKIEQLELIRGKGPQRLKATFCDETGCMELVWFQSIATLQKMLKEGETYVAYGKVSEFKGVYSMSHPEMQQADVLKHAAPTGYVPVYPLTEKLKAHKIDSKLLASWTKEALEHPNFEMPEFIPERIREKLALPDRAEAFKLIHYPSQLQESAMALHRFKFEEVFLFQLRCEKTRITHRLLNKGPAISKPGYYFDTFYSQYLPFELTDAQKKVIKEIWSDMKSGVQMNRLLQGDVGSGKTVVAFISLLLAIDNGYQGCLMAPTEILSQQHYESLKEWASPLGLRVALLTGSTTKKERNEILEDLSKGELKLVIGTHAVIEDRVVFDKLGLVVIDEQHRFGVAQRARLWLKANPAPHMLVMTATPIPRTLAMTAHGESDHSILDQLPKGRKPIVTVHREDFQRTDVMFFIKNEIAKGRQVYFVFPLIEESEHHDYKNLMEGFDMVTYYFPTPEYKLSIVHGRMKAEDKEMEMQRFKSGKSDIMVATTVIEVGVNVPNASVMVIESAERFGLSQLHQLRGRVGRGAEQSYCILMTKEKLSQTAKERMQAMVKHTDGFEIAKIDLKQRGPGDILGTRQSGLPEFKYIDLVRDESIIVMARQAAVYVLKKDPDLKLAEHAALKNYLLMHAKDNFWSKIS